MLVDDSDDVVTVVSRTLARGGFEPVVCSNLAQVNEALERLDSLDLLITDVVLRGERGPQVTEAVRARFPDVPVIYISGYAAGALEGEALHGRTTFVPKPFSSRVLLEHVRGVLDGT